MERNFVILLVLGLCITLALAFINIYLAGIAFILLSPPDVSHDNAGYDRLPGYRDTAKG
jgi:hypothetical protein